MLNYKIIASDIDGTLLDNNHLLSSENEQEIINLINDGHYFVMNSGALPRDSRKILELSKIGINDQTKWFVGINGVIVYNFKTEETFINITNRDQNGIAQVCKDFDRANTDIVEINNQKYLHYVIKNELTWFDLMSKLYATYLQDGSDKLKGFEDLLNIMNHYDKTNLTLKDIIYFGDNINDIPVFQNKDIDCIAVENAIDPIKQLANDHTTNNVTGVADYLKKIK